MPYSNPPCRAIRRAAANYANAKTAAAQEAALKRIARLGGTVEYHRPTDTTGVGSRHLGWAVIP